MEAGLRTDQRSCPRFPPDTMTKWQIRWIFNRKHLCNKLLSTGASLPRGLNQRDKLAPEARKHAQGGPVAGDPADAAVSLAMRGSALILAAARRCKISRWVK